LNARDVPAAVKTATIFRLYKIFNFLTSRETTDVSENTQHQTVILYAPDTKFRTIISDIMLPGDPTFSQFVTT
jgi:hypothetical protein